MDRFPHGSSCWGSSRTGLRHRTRRGCASERYYAMGHRGVARPWRCRRAGILELLGKCAANRAAAAARLTEGTQLLNTQMLAYLTLARHPRLVAASVLATVVMLGMKFALGIACADMAPSIDWSPGAVPHLLACLATAAMGSTLGASVMLSTWRQLALGRATGTAVAREGGFDAMG